MSIVSLRKTRSSGHNNFKQMVDDMHVAVMTCDLNTFEIDYLNKASIDALRTIEDVLPVKADAMQGQCIDIFHKMPDHQRRLLADPSNLPHRALIKLGDETLDLNVSALRDTEDEYISPMLSWSLVTQNIRLADNVSDVVSAVLQTTTKVITK